MTDINFSLSRVLPEDVSIHYLDTLNDSHYLRFSSTSKKKHSHNSQTRYVKNAFSNKTFLIGARSETGKILGTSLLTLDVEKREVNIGMLILKENSNLGLGRSFLNRISNLLLELLPEYTPVIGTLDSNNAMIKTARNCGYIPFREENGRVFFKKESPRALVHEDFPPLMAKAEKIVIVCSDTGSAQNGVDLRCKIGSRKEVEFVAEGYARRFLESKRIPVSDRNTLESATSAYFVIGTGHGSDLETNAVVLASEQRIAYSRLLDHFVNYQDRLLPKERKSPSLITLDRMSSRIAAGVFPTGTIYLLEEKSSPVPSFLESIKKESEKRTRSILVVLDTLNSSYANDFFPVTLNQIEGLVTKIQLSASSLSPRIDFRLHPAEEHHKELANWISTRNFNVLNPLDANLKTQAEGYDMVCGFNSYSLFTTAKAGLPTFSFYGQTALHWTRLFSNKLKITP